MEGEREREKELDELGRLNRMEFRPDGAVDCRSAIRKPSTSPFYQNNNYNNNNHNNNNNNDYND